MRSPRGPATGPDSSVAGAPASSQDTNVCSSVSSLKARGHRRLGRSTTRGSRGSATG
ncbi:hypothetical protein SORBI_3007G094700 [Sorghum bicolor]|uniref:Uncharacterized protein n=1 Tax=Sorghum bicolor TaxID=4558 RepID=A0A1Z5R9H3_SORBI|nr:hypothetical protein SORBI_3007G094700 [Sorghum bicolor]OQU80210.1 hypothetical protein SORBI_3007G094700 [Sorghum bicolor]OQU80211.1 hypothetical protein SORBI_3007G094700 [Sorghum bicolor]